MGSKCYPLLLSSVWCLSLYVTNYYINPMILNKFSWSTSFPNNFFASFLWWPLCFLSLESKIHESIIQSYYLNNSAMVLTYFFLNLRSPQKIMVLYWAIFLDNVSAIKQLNSAIFNTIFSLDIIQYVQCNKYIFLSTSQWAILVTIPSLLTAVWSGVIGQQNVLITGHCL